MPRREEAEQIAAGIRCRMAKRRYELGLSLQDVADRASLAKAHVWQLECGMSGNPTLSSIVWIAQALDLSVADLMGLGETPERKAREARLGPNAHPGKLPDRLFAAMMDGSTHSPHDLGRLLNPDETRKQLYNALGYLTRHGQIKRLGHKQYKVCLTAGAPDAP